MKTRLYLFITVLLPVILVYGCASNKVYVDTDEVPGLGVMVEFPTGKIVPIDVKRVISGNEIELTNGERAVYIGVHIPNMYDLPRAAMELNKQFVLSNDIRLEFDKRQRDSRGRLLAYVYTTDGTFVNAELIRGGMAKLMMKPPNFKEKDLLQKAEDEARANQRGAWSKEFCVIAP
ncbi:thermonuclease family protein [Candidatus Omnitrophota bacterium]